MKHTTFRPTDLSAKILSIDGFRVRLTTYCLEDTYYCSVDNINPGAVIFRGRGRDSEEAEHAALQGARQIFLALSKH